MRAQNVWLFALACLLFVARLDPAGAQPPPQTFRLDLAESREQAPATGNGSVQFIGTATVLIRYQGFTILTDPNFLHKGDHVHLGYGITSERLTNPAIDLQNLPPIDLVVLSHMHEDHFDKLVQEKLAHAIPIVTTREAAENLKKIGFTRTFGLHHWDNVEVRKGDARLRITSVPGRHGKAGMQALLPTVMGSVLDFGPQVDSPSYRMYISGDTLIYDDIRTIPKRFPGIDLALLHLGGTRILGVFKVTMDGEDGVQIMQIIQPDKAIPIHYNDYDVFKSPLADFARAVKAAGLEQKVVYLKHGDIYDFTPAPGAHNRSSLPPSTRSQAP
jgi:L-ascorbate metabolism protein UlaG (beta-lactamase superfamily)